MVRFLRTLGVTLIAGLVLASTAQAELKFRPGPYLTAQLQGVFVQQTDFMEDGPTSTKRQFDFESGYLANAGIGYRLRDWLRMEIELGYRTSSIASIKEAGVELFNSEGTYGGLSGMVNTWIDMTQFGQVVPYFGFGFGGIGINADGWRANGLTVPESSSTALALQLGGGVAYQLTEKLALTADYRWLWAPGQLELQGFAKEVEYGAHNIGIGLRLGF